MAAPTLSKMAAPSLEQLLAELLEPDSAGIRQVPGIRENLGIFGNSEDIPGFSRPLRAVFQATARLREALEEPRTLEGLAVLLREAERPQV